MSFSINHEIKITDLILSLSVLCAACTLIYTWAKDRHLRSKEYADKIRAAAAVTLSKVDRCQHLFESITDRVQRYITDADTMIVSTKDVVKCRDEFWKNLHLLRADILSEFQSEGIEVSYAPLLIYRTDIYELFRDSMLAARAIEAASFTVLQTECQRVILDVDVSQVRSATLGNALRQVCHEHADQLATQLSYAFNDIRKFLRSILSMSDLGIVRPSTSELKLEKGAEFINTSYWLHQWRGHGFAQAHQAFYSDLEVCVPVESRTVPPRSSSWPLAKLA